MFEKEQCEGCGAGFDRATYVTHDDIWLCRKCYYEVPMAAEAVRMRRDKPVAASLDEETPAQPFMTTVADAAIGTMASSIGGPWDSNPQTLETITVVASDEDNKP